MAKKVTIVGDLVIKSNRDDLLNKLNEFNADVDWDWLKPDNPQCKLPHKPFARLCHGLRSGQYEDITLIKLKNINGKDANELYKLVPDPVLPPRHLSSIDKLVTWITDSSGLFTEIVPELRVLEVTLFAILAKLIRNKSWNKDKQGHQWTKETDLLSQAPVVIDDMPDVANQANFVLNRCSGELLITKGGKQGKTPMGWCINSKYLPAVKRSIVANSLDPLREINELNKMMGHIDNTDNRLLPLDSRIISERVLSVCRDR